MLYEVPLFAQTSSMSCWAASIAMMLGWKNQQCIGDITIAANPGGRSYMPEFQNGLDPNDRHILERNGLSMDAPMCYTMGLVRDMVDAHGPLWVAGYVPLALPGGRTTTVPHIRVVIGHFGDQLAVNDPWPVDRGSHYRASFSSFFGQMETLGARERAEPAPVYVAYLAA